MKKVIVCLSPVVKAMIVAEAQEAKIDWRAKKAIEELMEEFPDCDEGAPVDYDEIDESGGGGKKKKRPPSEYQQFIGKCMKAAGIKSFAEAPAKMKNCVKEWHEYKKKKS